MNSAVLSLGSNSIDKATQMHNCIKCLKENYSVSHRSSPYSSPALNGKDADYLNAVVRIETTLDHEALKQALKQHEKACGRTKQSKIEGSIPIDIDIVIWNDTIVREKDFNQTYFQIGWKEISK